MDFGLKTASGKAIAARSLDKIIKQALFEGEKFGR